MIYARIEGGIVSELIDIPTGSPPLSARYHPDIVASCVPVGSDVREGWLYDGHTFSPPPPEPPQLRYVPVPIMRERLEEAGLWDAAATALAQNAPMMIKLLTLREGVAPDDVEARDFLTQIGADPDIILAP